MEELKQAIREKGVGIGTDIVKVDSFLNHRIDVALATRMGQTIAEAFADDGVDCILTVEASSITVAVTAAQALGCVPVVFAKKSAHVNVGNDVYTAQVYSFTQKKTNTIRVSAAYLPAGARVLIVDDFLADGGAVAGLREILRQAGCQLAGVAICVEKGFQDGGKRLRAEGVKLVSLAIVDAIEDGKIILRDD